MLFFIIRPCFMIRDFVLIVTFIKAFSFIKSLLARVFPRRNMVLYFEGENLKRNEAINQKDNHKRLLQGKVK